MKNKAIILPSKSENNEFSQVRMALQGNLLLG